MRDNVQCSNCGTRSLVEMGAEECPKCGTTGALAWVEGEPQEVRETRAPSAGAMRVARETYIVQGIIVPSDEAVAKRAAWIDRETGLGEAAKALRACAKLSDRIPVGEHAQVLRALARIEGREEARERTVATLPSGAPVPGCTGCGRVDPCGYHYEDCTLLEPGDGLVERGTERVVGYYDGPDMSGLDTPEEAQR